MAAMEKLQKQGMKKLIFDIRGNGGGILEEAVDIADEFLDSTKLVLYTEGVHAKRREYNCKRPGLFEKGDLVLIVDEFSASASEVLAGALQDWDRATIVGRRSFGKGLVQEPFELSDGSQIRLTVSKYYTPSGRNIQKPFQVDHEAYGDEVYERFQNGQAYKQDTTHTGKVYRTKLKNRVVYGGGGISPDFFIPLDSGRISNRIPLYSGTVLSKYLYEYYVNHINSFSQFKTAAEFEKGFTVTDDSWNEIKAYAKRDSINTSGLDSLDKQELSQRFKTLMALQIWRQQGFYELANQTDKAVQKAKEILK
jgi:carboxyl-terminal processing protease